MRTETRVEQTQVTVTCDSCGGLIVEYVAAGEQASEEREREKQSKCAVCGRHYCRSDARELTHCRELGDYSFGACGVVRVCLSKPCQEAFDRIQKDRNRRLAQVDAATREMLAAARVIETERAEAAGPEFQLITASGVPYDKLWLLQDREGLQGVLAPVTVGGDYRKRHSDILKWGGTDAEPARSAADANSDAGAE